MVRLVTCAFLLVACSSCTLRVRQPSESEKSQITAEILALTRQVQAAAERADAAGLFMYHSDASEYIHIHNGVRYTRDELVANYQGIYRDVEKQEIDIGDPVISILSQDLVLVASQGTFKTTMKSGAFLNGDIAWTYLWKRDNESWKLLHAHQSFPGPIGRADG